MMVVTVAVIGASDLASVRSFGPIRRSDNLGDGVRYAVAVIGDDVKICAFGGELELTLFSVTFMVLSLAALAYGLGHAATFRRLFFATWQADRSVVKLGDGLGFIEHCAAAPELGTFTIPSAAAIGEHCDGAERFRAICRALREQGCPGVPE